MVVVVVVVVLCCGCCDDADNGWLEPGWEVNCCWDDEDVGSGFHDADNGAWVRRMLLFNNRFHNDNAMILRWAMF